MFVGVFSDDYFQLGLMEIKKMSTVPAIVAVTTAREASDHTRALDVLSDRRSLGAHIVLGLLIFVAAASGTVLLRSGVFQTETFATFGVTFALVVAVVLGTQVYHLRRRVKALTYLLLQRERMEP